MAAAAVWAQRLRPQSQRRVEQGALTEFHRRHDDVHRPTGIHHRRLDAPFGLAELDRAEHDEMPRPLDRLRIEDPDEIVLRERHDGMAGAGARRV